MFLQASHQPPKPASAMSHFSSANRRLSAPTAYQTLLCYLSGMRLSLMAHKSLAELRHPSFPKQWLGPANRQPGHDTSYLSRSDRNPSNVRMYERAPAGSKLHAFPTLAPLRPSALLRLHDHFSSLPTSFVREFHLRYLSSSNIFSCCFH